MKFKGGVKREQNKERLNRRVATKSETSVGAENNTTKHTCTSETNKECTMQPSVKTASVCEFPFKLNYDALIWSVCKTFEIVSM